MSSSSSFVVSKRRKASHQDYEAKCLIPNPILRPSLLLYLNSDQRDSGEVNNSVFSIIPPYPKAVYASSLKEFTFLNTIYTFQNNLVWANIYEANPSSFPTQITLTQGTYTYGNGTVLLADAYPTIPSVYQNDLRYVLINGFQGAITSIAVNSITNRWQIDWDATIVTAGWNTLLTSADLYSIMNLPSSTVGAIWSTLGPVNLSPPTQLALASVKLDNEQLTSTKGPNTWFCVVDVDQGPGEMVYHTPIREDRTEHSRPFDLATLTIQILNPLDQSFIQGLVSWSLIMRLYIEEHPC